MIPSIAKDWKTVRGTSPVPGGISMNMKSTSPQITSVQNCFTVLPRIGPLQITGSVSFSRRRLIDIISIPVLLFKGYKPSSLPVALGLPEHLSNSNVYMTVVRGMLSIGLNDQDIHEYEAGTLLKIPFQTKMNVNNLHDETLELIVVKAPAPNN